MMASILLFGTLVTSSIGGYVRFESYVRMDSTRKLYKLASTFQLKASIERGNFSGMGIFNLIYDRIGDSSFVVRPIEAYLLYRWRSFDITLGKKILTWGTGTYLSPTDIVNPWDFTYLYSDLEEFREGIETILLDSYRGNSFLELGFIPKMRPNRYPIPETFQTVTMVPGYKTTIHMDANNPFLPENDLKKGEYLVRVGTTLGPIDLMGLYFNGYDRDPDLFVTYKFLPDSMGSVPDTIDIRLSYNRVKAIGLNFSWVVSFYEFHGDFLYFDTKDSEGSDPLVKNPYFFGALGLGRTLFEDRLNLSCDFLLKRVINFREPGIHDFFEEEARRLSFQYDETMPYLSYNLSYTPLSNLWRLNLMGIYDMKAKEQFSILSFDYDWADGVDMRIGAILSGKEGRSPFTQMGKHYGQVAFLEGRFSF